MDRAPAGSGNAPVSPGRHRPVPGGSHWRPPGRCSGRSVGTGRLRGLPPVDAMSTDPPPTLLDILQQTFPQWQIHQDPLSGKWTADRLTPKTPLTREVGIPQRLEVSALEDLSPHLSQWTCLLSTLPSTR